MEEVEEEVEPESSSSTSTGSTVSNAENALICVDDNIDHKNNNVDHSRGLQVPDEVVAERVEALVAQYPQDSQQNQVD